MTRDDLVKAGRLDELMKEADELLAIVVSSAKTARSSNERVNHIS